MQKGAMQSMEVGSDSPNTSEVCQVSKLESGGPNRKRGSRPRQARPRKRRFRVWGCAGLQSLGLPALELAVGFAHITRKFDRSHIRV